MTTEESEGAVGNSINLKSRWTSRGYSGRLQWSTSVCPRPKTKGEDRGPVYGSIRGWGMTTEAPRRVVWGSSSLPLRHLGLQWFGVSRSSSRLGPGVWVIPGADPLPVPGSDERATHDTERGSSYHRCDVCGDRGTSERPESRVTQACSRVSVDPHREKGPGRGRPDGTPTGRDGLGRGPRTVPAEVPLSVWTTMGQSRVSPVSRDRKGQRSRGGCGDFV